MYGLVLRYIKNLNCKILPKKVEYLNIYNCHIKEIPLINSFHISLEMNQIEKIENLPINLKSLDLKYNYIIKIENLPNSLTYLDLSFNLIEKIENLPGELASLKLTKNFIKKIENLPESLLYLHIDQNGIRLVENIPINLIQLCVGNIYGIHKSKIYNIQEIGIQNLPILVEHLNGHII